MIDCVSVHYAYHQSIIYWTDKLGETIHVHVPGTYIVHVYCSHSHRVVSYHCERVGRDLVILPTCPAKTSARVRSVDLALKRDLYPHLYTSGGAGSDSWHRSWHCPKNYTDQISERARQIPGIL